MFFGYFFFHSGLFQAQNKFKKIPVRDVACNAGVFFGRANVFAHESAMLKLSEERRKWGESRGAGRGERERRENACPKTL